MERKGRNERTIANYRDHMERLFKDWLDAPLAQLGEKPTLVVDRHDHITAENGPYIANGSMRSLRAVYNHAAKANRDLPPVNPVTAIDWNKEKRRDTGIGSDDVVGWLGELHALPNALRREFHLMTVLSGSRPTALKNVRIEDINLHDRLLHIPKPKGGEDKAFDIPLSRPMVRCILRAMRLGRTFFPAESAIWLFPADSESGHLEEHKEDRSELSKWGNDLRQTYRNLAQVAGVGESDIHLLMNHALPGVNGGYLTRDRLTRNHLRAQQERISSVMIEQLCKAEVGALLAWLTRIKVDDQAGHATYNTVEAAASRRTKKALTTERLVQAVAA
jgi:integrase